MIIDRSLASALIAGAPNCKLSEIIWSELLYANLYSISNNSVILLSEQLFPIVTII